MAYNVGEGTGNFQFTQSGKNVLKGLEQSIKNAIAIAVKLTANETLERLRNQSASEQITPRDIYRNLYSGVKAKNKRLEDSWTMRARNSGSSLNYEFRNRLPHASLVYSDQDSVGHNVGFRSADNYHEENPFLYVNGKKVELEKRPDQLTRKKWYKFLGDRQTALTKAINKEIRKIK